MSERRLPGVANKVLRRRILRSERQIIPAVLRTPHQRIRRESPEAATASDSAQASPRAAGAFGAALSLSYADAAGLCNLQMAPASEPAAEVAWSNVVPFAGAWPPGQGERPSLHAPLPDAGACPRAGSVRSAVRVDVRASASQVDAASHIRRGGHDLPAASSSCELSDLGAAGAHRAGHDLPAASAPSAQGSARWDSRYPSDAPPSAARALRTPDWPLATSWHAPGHTTPPSAPTPASSCASYLPPDSPRHGLGILKGLNLVEDRSDLPAHHGIYRADYPRDHSLRAGTPPPPESCFTSSTDWERVTSAEDRAFARLLSGGVFWGTNEYEPAPDIQFLPRPWNMCSTNL